MHSFLQPALPTFGAFPFELGRGIALGTAYAVDASDLGFYSENAIDQYAFGGKFLEILLRINLPMICMQQFLTIRQVRSTMPI